LILSWPCADNAREIRWFLARFGNWIAATVIACDKREAFAQGSEATKQSIYPRVEDWIASAFALGATADKSLRSQ